MQLRHETEPEQAIDTSTSTSDRFTAEELNEVLNTAILRHDEALREEQSTATVQDAVRIAAELNIPEEHVISAARDLQARRGKRERMRILGRQRRGEFVSILIMVATSLLFFGDLSTRSQYLFITLACCLLVATGIRWFRSRQSS